MFAGDAVTATALKAIKSASAEEARDRAAEKAAKKAAFDTEYDVGAPWSTRATNGPVKYARHVHQACMILVRALTARESQ